MQPEKPTLEDYFRVTDSSTDTERQLMLTRQRMTEEQRAELVSQSMPRFVILCFLAAFASFFLIAQIISIFNSPNGFASLTVREVFYIVTVGAIDLYGVGAGLALNRDLRDGKVKYLEGPVRITFTARRYRHVLWLGDESFQLPQTVIDRVTDGKSYRVYYTPHSKKVVGVEPLE